MTTARGAARPGGERLSREERLCKRAEFARCYRQGRRRQSAVATLHAVANSCGHPRLGITVGRKVGGAVVRHRLKRQVREIYRRWSQRHRLRPLDLVVHLKPPAREVGFGELRREVEALLRSHIRRPRAS